MTDVPKHMYICEKSKEFKIRLKDGPPEDIWAHFQNGVFQTGDDEIAALFDQLLLKPNISALVRKVDWAKANSVAATHIKETEQRSATVKGPMSSMDLQKRKLHATEEDARAQLLAKGVPAEKIDGLVSALKADGLELPVKVELPDTGKVEAVPTQLAPTKPPAGRMTFGTQAKTT